MRLVYGINRDYDANVCDCCQITATVGGFLVKI